MPTSQTDRLLRGGIVLLSAVLVYFIYAGIHQRIVVAGDAAPEFSITADNGRTVTLPSFGGKLLVLNFWATWCPPCVQETPSLSRFAATYAPKGVVVLGISVDKDEAAYRAFLRKFSPEFLTVREDKLHEDYGTYMYPETYIIDAKGKVLQKLAEPADWMDPRMTQLIDSLL
jgi:cytochrome c biogenesis protein CcmG, thiol:disulfide interchange protein DsbE